MKRLFGDKPPKTVKDRLAHELKVVSKNGHSSIYFLAGLIAREAYRLQYPIFFRGTFTGSLIAYTSGASCVNPMEKEYGGFNLPFEITREEYEGIEPALDIRCNMAFIFFIQSFLVKILPEYRCISYPLDAVNGIRAVRLYLIKDDDLPAEDPVDAGVMSPNEYPDYVIHVKLCAYGASEMEKDQKQFNESI